MCLGDESGEVAPADRGMKSPLHEAECDSETWNELGHLRTQLDLGAADLRQGQSAAFPTCEQPAANRRCS